MNHCTSGPGSPADQRKGVACYSVGVLAFVLVVVGCQSPLGPREPNEMLRQSVENTVQRELASLPEANTRLETTQQPSETEHALEQRRQELDALGPYSRTQRDRYDLGVDLTGADQQELAINLESAIRSSVVSNLPVQRARLEPAITEAQVVVAEAAFDAIFFASGRFSRTDQPQTTPIIMGIPVGTPVTGRETQRYETGIRQPLRSGGELSISTDLTRSENRTPGLGLAPDPAYSSAVRLSLSQPLLRGFGSDVNTASIRLARTENRRSVEQLRSDLLNLVNNVESAYWSLVFAWHDLAILQWLVDQGTGVRDVLEARQEFDTRLAQFADAVATVEQRKANVIRARRELRLRSDQLKALINDPELTVGSEVLLRPVDAMVAAPISYNLRDALTTAISNRPEVRQAVLAIDDASVRQLLADNSRLPILNLSAELAYFGLDDSSSGSYSNLNDGDFVDYAIGLSFEMPIGNRAAEAEYRAARLRRSSTVIGYRQAVQNIVLDVKAALRDVITNFELIQATRSFRVAQAENLRALLAEEETMAGLTPEFLDLKLRRQEGLANARQQELLALVQYDQSVATLYRALGIGLSMNRIDIEIVDENGSPTGE